MDEMTKMKVKKGARIGVLLDLAGFKPHQIVAHLDRIARANAMTLKELDDMPNDRLLFVPKDIADKLD